jgi:hypothetical protein
MVVRSARRVFRMNQLVQHLELLTYGRICGIISETIEKPIRGDRGAHQERQQAGQDQGSRRRGHVESGARKSPGSKVPRRRVLRSARHRAGQVRDATPRFGRERVGDQRDGRLRRVEADILPNQSQLPGSWNRRVGAQETGSTRPAQGTGCGAGVYPGATGRGRAPSSAPIGRTDPEKIRSRYPPKDDRANRSGKKNRAVTGDGGESSEQLAGIASQYEALRNAALGYALPLEARSGLLLFLRRGMWGWARAMTTAVASPPLPRCTASLSFPHRRRIKNRYSYLRGHGH